MSFRHSQIWAFLFVGCFVCFLQERAEAASAPVLTQGNTYSFRSNNYPPFYIRSYGVPGNVIDQFRLARNDGSDLMALDQSFTARTPRDSSQSTACTSRTGNLYSFESLTNTGYYITGSASSSYYVSLEDTSTPARDQTFCVIPGINSATDVSLIWASSTSFALGSPNCRYIRHYSFGLSVVADDGTSAFDGDVTYTLLPGFSSSSNPGAPNITFPSSGLYYSICAYNGATPYYLTASGTTAGSGFTTSTNPATPMSATFKITPGLATTATASAPFRWLSMQPLSSTFYVGLSGTTLSLVGATAPSNTWVYEPGWADPTKITFKSFTLQYGLIQAFGSLAVIDWNLSGVTWEFCPPLVASVTPTVTITSSITATVTVTPSQSKSVTSSITPSLTPTITVTATTSITTSISESMTSSITPSMTVTATSSITPSATASVTVTSTASITPSISESVTSSITPTVTVTITPSVTASVSVTATASITPSISESVTSSITPSMTVTATSSITPTATASITSTTTASVTGSVSGSKTMSITPSITPSITFTATVTRSPSSTISVTNSAFSTPSNEATSTASMSLSPVETVSVTPSPSTNFKVLSCQEIVCEDDGDPCTVEVCVDGVCNHQSWVCDDTEICTVDQCVNGKCEFVSIAGCDASDCRSSSSCDSCSSMSGCAWVECTRDTSFVSNLTSVSLNNGTGLVGYYSHSPMPGFESFLGEKGWFILGEVRVYLFDSSDIVRFGQESQQFGACVSEDSVDQVVSQYETADVTCERDTGCVSEVVNELSAQIGSIATSVGVAGGGGVGCSCGMCLIVFIFYRRQKTKKDEFDQAKVVSIEQESATKFSLLFDEKEQVMNPLFQND